MPQSAFLAMRRLPRGNSFPEPKPPETWSLDETDEDATMNESELTNDIDLDLNRLCPISFS